MSEPRDISDLPPLRDVVAAYGLTARRSLGQNFLLDLNITRRIARAAGSLEGKTVLEIGAGPGGLTRALLETDALQVVTLERDPRCVDALQDLTLAAGDRLRIIEQDALDLDIAHVADDTASITIVANLPYNIAAPLLIKWLKSLDWIDRMILMFQREVADRLTANPGSRTYGRLSVAAQWRCEVTPLFSLPGRAFTPPPKVDSTVVQFNPRRPPLSEADPDALEKVVAAAFSQRRKMLRSALKGMFDNPSSVLDEAGISSEARAETVNIEGFCALARAFKSEHG